MRKQFLRGTALHGSVVPTTPAYSQSILTPYLARKMLRANAIWSLYRQGKMRFEGGAGVTAEPIFVPYRNVTPQADRVGCAQSVCTVSQHSWRYRALS